MTAPAGALAGKTVAVTGGSMGIGLACALSGVFLTRQAAEAEADAKGEVAS